MSNGSGASFLEDPFLDSERAFSRSVNSNIFSPTEGPKAGGVGASKSIRLSHPSVDEHNIILSQRNPQQSKEVKRNQLIIYRYSYLFQVPAAKLVLEVLSSLYPLSPHISNCSPFPPILQSNSEVLSLASHCNILDRRSKLYTNKNKLRVTKLFDNILLTN